MLLNNTYNMNEFGIGQEEISKYNDAGLSILRLDEMWKSCRFHINSGNLRAWKYELDNVWLELFNDLNRMKNNKEILKKNNFFMSQIGNAKKDRNKLYFALLQRHQFLRWLQDKAGKAGVYIDANSDLSE